MINSAQRTIIWISICVFTLSFQSIKAQVLPSWVDLTPLMESIKQGDERLTERRLNASNASERTAREYTPLIIAGMYNRANIILLLSDYGVKLDVQNIDGYSALSYAARFGNQDALKLLIELGADVNLEVKDGRTPLHLATQYAHIDAIELLVRNGAIVNAVDNKGYTPLMFAVMAGYEPLVQFFLDMGADTSARNNEGETVFDIARKKDFDKVLETLQGS